MALDQQHLTYPLRRYGMDHDRYQWSMLAKRPAVQWPQGKKLALWVNVCLQHFPLNQQGIPFKVPGGMTMPYPDLRHYSLRDYGNRVGLYRILAALDKYRVTPTFAVNSELLDRTPYISAMLKERGNELICHGWNMDALHYGGQDKQIEAELIKRSLDTINRYAPQPVRGWLSPARNESENTPDLLAEQGIEYVCNWVNDDMPYPFHTASGALTAMPLSTELEDRFILINNLHSEQSYVEQLCDSCDMLLNEAEQQGGRILALNIHPWLLGQPHRINFLEKALEYITSKGVWSAASGEILDCFKRV